MKGSVTIKGTVVSGARKAAQFTRLAWVESQCMEKLGFKPYPGTLNIRLQPGEHAVFRAIEQKACSELVPPDPFSCAARIIPAYAGSIEAALVLPSEEVRVHGNDVLEVIAPVCLREALGIGDGDEVTLSIESPPVPCFFLKGIDGSRRSPLTAMIFDLDGTLLDTRDIFFTIVEMVFEKLRFPGVSKEALVEAAAEGDFDWDMILPETARTRTGEVMPQIRSIVEEISPSLFLERNAMISGSHELLKRLSSAGIKLGVVTSTKRRHLQMKLRPIREAGLEMVFHAVVAAGDTERQKPFPDPLLECARKLGVVPGACAYAGDMRMDIRSGKAAGMLTIGVLTGFDTYATLKAEGADIVLDSVASLQERLTLSSTRLSP